MYSLLENMGNLRKKIHPTKKRVSPPRISRVGPPDRNHPRHRTGCLDVGFQRGSLEPRGL